MTAIAIRKSGGAQIISLPKAVLSSLGLHTGSKLELTIIDEKIVLEPIKEKEEITLEMLLAASPQACFQVTDEDQQWLDAEPVGKEVL